MPTVFGRICHLGGDSSGGGEVPGIDVGGLAPIRKGVYERGLAVVPLTRGFPNFSHSCFLVILLPAIDLMSGEVVRLRQGRADQKTVYSRDPAAFAKEWEEQGGDYLHIVDLDAAFSGELRNLDSVRLIAEAISIPCELGGGMRSRKAILQALEAGVDRVIIGTRAAESLEFVEEMAREFGSDRIAVGIDARNGMVSTKGWTEQSKLPALDLARSVESAGAGTIVYTDIATDGMLQGPNFGEMERVLAEVECRLVASGGVSSPADVERLAEMPGLYGCIIGKALYDGAVQLRDLSAIVRKKKETIEI